MRRSENFDRPPYTKVLGALVVTGAAALIATPMIRKLKRRWAVTHPRARTEPAIDESLQDTYPASDPPASRYFDIPVNRR